MTIVFYRTYSYEPFSRKLFNKPWGNFLNKPRHGGLWGCRGDEWKEWCEDNEFSHFNNQYFLWCFNQEAKIMYIDSYKDFLKYVKLYPDEDQIYFREKTLDFNKILEAGYDGVEVTWNAIWESKESELIGLGIWDIPSVVALNIDKVLVLNYGSLIGGKERDVQVYNDRCEQEQHQLCSEEV